MIDYCKNVIDSWGQELNGNTVISLIAGALGALALALYDFQNSKLWDEGQDVSTLKASVVAIDNQLSRTEHKLDTVDTILSSVATSLDVLRANNNDAVTAASNLASQIHDLQKQVSDIDLMLRPPRVFTDGGKGR